MIRHWMSNASGLLRAVRSLTFWQVLGVVLVASLFGLLLGRGLWSRWRRRWFPVMVVLAVGMVFLLVAASVVYLRGPVHLGPIEVTNVANACMLADGKGLYHEMDSGDRFGNMYGPMSHVPPALAARLLGKSAWSVKLPCVLFAWATLVAVGVAAWRLGGVRAGVVGLLTAATAMLLLSQQSFVIHGDPQGMLWAALAVWASTSRRVAVRATVLGVALGATVNIKFHFPLYLLPLIALEYQRTRWRGVLLAGAVGALLAPLPFLLSPQIHFGRYLAIVRMVSGRPPGRHFAAMLQREAALLLPALVLLAILQSRATDADRTLLRRNRWVLIAALLSWAPVTYAGGLEGGGPVHLVVYIPMIAVFTGWLASRVSRIGQTVGQTDSQTEVPIVRDAVLLAVVFAGVLSAGMAGRGYIRDCLRQAPDSRAMHREIREIVARHPGQTVAMGSGEWSQDPRIYARTELLYQGQPYWLDTSVLMDCQKAGQGLPEAIRERMRRGYTPVWLIPRGDKPFVVLNRLLVHGRETPLFDNAFRDDFKRYYRVCEQTKHYTVWQYIGDVSESQPAP